MKGERTHRMMEAEIVELRAQLAEADSVIARSFPTARVGSVREDTLRCVERHRARVREKNL